jgi:hypothetical protein
MYGVVGKELPLQPCTAGNVPGIGVQCVEYPRLCLMPEIFVSNA